MALKKKKTDCQTEQRVLLCFDVHSSFRVYAMTFLEHNKESFSPLKTNTKKEEEEMRDNHLAQPVPNRFFSSFLLCTSYQLRFVLFRLFFFIYFLFLYRICLSSDEEKEQSMNLM